jgi:molybdenum cofactor cytidylyltransferase
MKQHAIIILAAGSSSRFGHPKQLAKYLEENFIRHALSQAINTSANVIVVLGANFDAVEKEIRDFPVRVAYNKDWEEGMSSSIRCGLAGLLKENASADAALFMVCDQPFVTSSLLNEMITKYEETMKPIIATAYKDTIGTPVLFDKIFFPALSQLLGPSGAKKIISENKDSIITIPFPLGYIDIDTKADYEALQRNQFNN